MADKLTNSNDIVANSAPLVSNHSVVHIWLYLCKKHEVIKEIVGLPLETLNATQKSAESINHDGSVYNTVTQ